MTVQRRLWGIHNDSYGQELIDGGFISISWSEVGDLRKIGNDQALMREALALRFPGKKPAAVAGWAGTLRRFAFESRVGDLVAFPNRQDRTLNFGRICGPYEYVPEVPLQPHRRAVTWLKTGVARTKFTQAALYELGSLLTMFAVRNNAEEFLAFIDAVDDFDFDQDLPKLEDEQSEEEAVDAAAAQMPDADRIDQHTRDYIAHVLLTEFTHEEFEYFTADLLRCMGYQARVTQYGGDGGVDVVAHKDLLGLEPPIIKVQCKHTTSTQGSPVVQQLMGTLDQAEAALFFTLGTYSGDALKIERQKQNLRLFSGADITELSLRYYDDLPPRWRSRMPLRRVLAADPS